MVEMPSNNMLPEATVLVGLMDGLNWDQCLSQKWRKITFGT